MKLSRGIVSVLVVALALPTHVNADTGLIRFEIPAQDLGEALRAFARASRLQVAFNAQSVKGQRSPSLNAALSAEEALTRLLRGTDLTFTQTRSGLFLIRRRLSQSPPQSVARLQRPRESRPPQAIPAKAPRSDIVVTARKRNELALDVPIALSVISGEAMERRGIKSLSDILPETPGVGLYDQGNGLTKLTIRGTSTSLGGNENGYYLDDLPFNGLTVPVAPDVRAWDLDRVEILRGPQGTLFGEGSMGGTVRILTKGADLYDWEAKGAAYISQTEGGGDNRGVKGALNAPIVPGILALRIAGTRERLSGWIDDAIDDIPDINIQSVTTFRTKLRFDPASRLSITGSYWRYSGSFPGGGAISSNAGEQSRFLQAATGTRYRLFSASARYDFSAMQLYYGYSHNTFDVDQLGTYLRGVLNSRVGVNVDAQELRLTSKRHGPLQWTAGTYTRTARRRDDATVEALAFAAIDDTDSKVKALFGEATYTLPSLPVDVTAGVRYHSENVGGSEGGGENPRGGDRYTSWNPRFSVAWHPVANSTIYLSASKGFRAGQLQPSYSITLAKAYGIELPPSISQDSIWTYELGVKAALLDGAFTFDGAVYYSRWKDMAVRIPIYATGANGLLNSPGTRAVGGEVGVAMRPLKNLTIAANASYVDAVYTGSVGGTGIVKDGPADDLPSFIAAASAEYSAWLASSLQLFGRIGWQHSSPRHFDAFPGNLPGDAIDRVDVRIGWMLGSVSVAAFADNLTDERGAVSYRTVQPVASGEDVSAYRLRPRTIGLEVNFRFQP